MTCFIFLSYLKCVEVRLIRAWLLEEKVASFLRFRLNVHGRNHEHGWQIAGASNKLVLSWICSFCLQIRLVSGFLKTLVGVIIIFHVLASPRATTYLFVKDHLSHINSLDLSLL